MYFHGTSHTNQSIRVTQNPDICMKKVVCGSLRKLPNCVCAFYTSTRDINPVESCSFTSRLTSLCLIFHSQKVFSMSNLSFCFCMPRVRLVITSSLRSMLCSYVCSNSFIDSSSFCKDVISPACLTFNRILKSLHQRTFL